MGRRRFRWAWIAAGFLATWAFAPSAWAQSDKPAAPAALRPSATSPVRMEIDDQGLGTRWLLVDDPAHPGGPGRLFAAEAGRPGPISTVRPAAPAVIHAGDAVQVEEHTAVLDGSLQAVALGSAAAGARLRVRLRVGGRILTAVALAPGRAVLETAGGKP